MRTKPECFSCFLNQVLSAGKRVTKDEEVLINAIKKASEILPYLSINDSPAYNTYLVLKRGYEILGNKDPYYEEKRKYNKLALSLYPTLKNIVKNSKDPLHTAVKIAIAGNIIDLGIVDLSKINIEEYIKMVLETPLPLEHYEYFKREVEKAKNIVYLLDNAGEIVFDKILIEELDGKRITAIVSEGPIINDAMMEDAIEVGLTQVCNVITSGSDTVGKIPELGSEEFKSALYNADVIIAKGQGNYENLDEKGLNIFFLLKAKCEIIAKSLGINFGDSALAYGPILRRCQNALKNHN
ncbi:MAG: damage-control phosphatase ARMT1 family protein [Dictyoglomaceae bacterium]